MAGHIKRMLLQLDECSNGWFKLLKLDSLGEIGKVMDKYRVVGAVHADIEKNTPITS